MQLLFKFAVPLKDYYAHIGIDTYIDIPDEVFDIFEEYRKAEQAYHSKINYHKAYYSLDRDDGIEHSTIHNFIHSGSCFCLAAYPLSRYELRFRNLFMYTILFMTSLPITAVMVPVYKMFLSIRLYDKIFGLILFLTATSLPYGIWLMKNFMDNVPIELEEAAWVDGETFLFPTFYCKV